MAKKIPVVPLHEKLMLSIEEAAALLGLGRDRLYRLVLDIEKDTRKPALHSVKVGRRRMIPRIALDRYIDKQMAA